MADTSPRGSIYAGDFYSWESDFGADYPATTWAAECVFQKPGEKPLRLEGVADGSAFDFTLTSLQSASMAPGAWTWAARVTKDTESKTVQTGGTTVRPNPTAEHVETHNERCLALVEAAMEDRLTDVQDAISILGQDISKVPAETLARIHNRYQSLVNKERRRRHYEITGNRPRAPRIQLK